MITTLLLSGKRKSGKDYIAEKLAAQIPNSQIIRLSAPLKRAFAREHNLDYDELMTPGAYKEQYRVAMIAWGEEKRQIEPGFFCSLAWATVNPQSEVVIVADCRRVTDFEFFINLKNVTPLSIRIEASDPIRMTRGYIYQWGVDDAESECGLDATDHDLTFLNDSESDNEFNELINTSILAPLTEAGTSAIRNVERSTGSNSPSPPGEQELAS